MMTLKDETVAEKQRLADIAEWQRTEQIELCFRHGYLAGLSGIPEDEAWETSVVKKIRDARRQKLVKPIVPMG